jgi:hypothetical protein
MVTPAKSLSELVREDKFDEVKAYIQQSKQQHGLCWSSVGSIGEACRDAILLA